MIKLWFPNKDWKVVSNGLDVVPDNISIFFCCFKTRKYRWLSDGCTCSVTILDHVYKTCWMLIYYVYITYI